MIKVKIEVSTREGVLDPEAKAIHTALLHIDDKVAGLKKSTVFYVDLDVDCVDEANTKAIALCEELLVNLVIQDYKIEVLP
ncbi:phosphoribosylformylglycinamidine synthase subunit PurS [Helicobacter sp. 11S02629-2]|uniref:phosphoribosylformylglycinamidine synthase subunit PurS n=1 Tax=Helicobacter sp. 11S02629-2 TaxID=1476195 RepID=UPI000BA6B278|nr:phosphoribosylformylglycinamidine synthase subunit PurS [Helicobacter sp. 11S02629-2]